MMILRLKFQLTLLKCAILFKNCLLKFSRENVVKLRKYTEEKRATVKEEIKEEVIKLAKFGKCHWWKYRLV